METTKVVGGSSGIIRLLNETLDEETNYDPNFFRQILIGSDKLDSPLTLNMASTEYLDQIIFFMNDKRKQSTQCITFIGEDHTFNTRSLGIDVNIISVKVWTFCKLLQIKYSSSVAVYLELDDSVSHKKTYDRYNIAIQDAYLANAPFIEKLNQINEKDFNLEFLHKCCGRTFTFIASKKKNKPVVLRYGFIDVSQNFANIAHKLLHGRLDKQNWIDGLVFVDNRNSVMDRKYKDAIYNEDLDFLTENGISGLIGFINNLLNIYSDERGTTGKTSKTKFHIKSQLNSHSRDAQENDNHIFNNLFRIANITRHFYLLLLESISRLLGSKPTQTVVDIFYKKNIADFDTIEQLKNMYNVWPKTSSLSDSNNLSEVTEILMSTGRLEPLDQCTCADILHAAMSRIMDYNTMIRIYNNIFYSGYESYLPDYHIMVSGHSHTTFLKHCFKAATNFYDELEIDNIKRVDVDSSMLILSLESKSYSAKNFANMTYIYYPKSS